MKKFIGVILIGAAALLAFGYSSTKQQEYETISAQEAKEMMDSQDVVIVDVRTEEEFATGHIHNALNIPNEDINNVEPDELDDKNETILVYCRSGRRSAEAAAKLAKMGYSNVFDFGGILDWPYETER